jgi:hypothetical protein
VPKVTGSPSGLNFDHGRHLGFRHSCRHLGFLHPGSPMASVGAEDPVNPVAGLDMDLSVSWKRLAGGPLLG